jgi:2-keto-4-pentenoate hydratase
VQIGFIDDRIRRGLQAQLAKRRALLDGGARPLGWKVGFGAAAAMEKLKIGAPLVGFLLQSARLESDATVSLAGFAKPAAEPEIAVHMGKDLAAGADRAAAADAIGALGPAIEIADIDVPPDDVETILRGNIFQRHVVLGRGDPQRAGGEADGLTGIVFRRGAEVARTSDPQAATGNLIDIVRHVADVLAACGERLRAGEIIITGSVVPPIFLEPDERGLAFDLDPVGRIAVRFA